MTAQRPPAPTTCPVDGAPKHARDYLCRGCWFTLPKATRSVLNLRDDGAARRLAILYGKIQAGESLRTIVVPRHVS